MTTTITIHELSGERRSWTTTHRTADRDEAIRRAVAKRFGIRARFWQNSGLPDGYGSVVKSLTERQRSRYADSSTWSASVLLNNARIDVSPERPCDA